MREEFDKVLSEIKNKKAPGVYEIPAELLKYCGENTKKILYEMIYNIYRTGQWTSTNRFHKVHNCTYFKKT